MFRRRDYLNDPNAPAVNSLIPAASAIVVNGDGHILLQRRRDNDLWALPGGVMQFGEQITQTAIREVKEETHLNVEVTGLVGIYSDPGHVIAYSDGEIRQEFNICFAARVVGNDGLQLSNESTEVRFVAPDALTFIEMHPSTRLRIDHYLERRSEPYLG
jgi:ADP-ribose pyrophosphatase YjhB (NUDIX family)